MKTLTLVIPVYNEGKRLNKILDQLKKGFNFTGIKLTNIIFSNDGSTDETVSKIKYQISKIEKKIKGKVEIISYDKNRGRGYAVRTAALNSDSDYVLYTDADFSIPLFNLKRFIPYLNKNYDLLYGSKKMPDSKEIIKRKWTRRIVGYGHSLVASFVLGVTSWDFQGGFKIFSKKFINGTFRDMRIDRWGFDMEVIFLAKKLGYKTIELPVTWEHVENGSKVKLIRDILRSLKEMFLIKYYWTKKMYYRSAVRRFTLNKIYVLSPFPPKSGKYNHKNSALASFSANLLENLLRNNKDFAITVLADKYEQENNVWKENNLIVKRIWQRNDLFIYPKLLLEIYKKNVRKLLIHFEWNVFGNGFYYLMLFPFFLIGLKIIKIKTYVVLHGVIDDFDELKIFNSVKNKLLNTGAYFFYKSVISLAHRIIVNEESLKNKLPSTSKDLRKITVIPHGVDTKTSIIRKEYARKALKLNGDFINVFFGFLSYYKGPDILLDLYKSKQMKNNLLYLIGGASQNLQKDAGYQKYLSSLYQKVSDSNRVKITGFIEHNQIPFYLSACDLMIFPYRGMLSSSGPLSLSFTFEKPFILSRNLEGYFESIDFQDALKRSKLNKDDILFDLTPEDFLKKLIFAKQHMDKLSLLSRLMKAKRSWQKVAYQYSSLLQIN